jgi:hypothetical protein
MRISHKHRFIFLSKPRCASESIRSILDKYSDIKSSDKYPYHHHTSALELKQYFKKNGWNWDEYFKFISIRNPWDMLVSLYHYSKPDLNGLYFWERKKNGKTYQPNNPMTFEDWINKNNFYYWTLNRFILDEKGEWLVDLIIRTEELSEGMRRFFNELNLPALGIPHINKTTHKNYRHYYNTAMKNKVKKHFELDIEVGEYDF